MSYTDETVTVLHPLLRAVQDYSSAAKQCTESNTHKAHIRRVNISPQTALGK